MREKNAIKSFGEIAKNGALIITTVKHQKEIDNEPILPDVFDEVDEMPQFPGGMAGMMQYLSNNLRYPQDAREAGTQGRVIVSFIIEKDGSISNAKVAKSTYSSLDDEALRVVSAMPKWIPGKQNGEAVRVKYSVPVSFRLNGKEAPKPEGTVMSVPVLSPEEKAVIDENGRITINGRELKRRLFDGSHLDDNKVGLAIVNIMLNDIEHFDYEIDGKPVAAKDFVEVRQKDFSPIKSMEYIPKDSEHPKDRLLITTKEK
jgi:TonB family protein